MSLFQSIYNEQEELQPILEQFSKAIDPSKLHPWAASLFHKTITGPIIEKEIRQGLVPITPISEDSTLVKFQNSIVSVWDSAGLVAGR